jgi:Ca-activated chloride channel family protein
MSANFLYPPVLFFLVVPAALLYWTWLGSGRRLVLPFDHGRPGKGSGWRIALAIMESVPALLLAVAIILLAGPQRLGEPKDRRVLTNIELCLDISYSMTTPFGDGSRYDAAVKALEEFVTYRKGDAFGLTFFGNNNLHWVPLTSDVSALRCSAPFMRPENVPPWFNGTEIARAVRACAQVLCERQEGDRMILLVTDGDSNDIDDLRNGNEEQVARELKANNISVYAVIIGQPEIQDEIVTLTQLTGGDAFLGGDDTNALKTVFRRIDEMKQTRVEKTIGETLDDFYPWSIAGLAFLGVGMTSLFGLRYTPW